MAAIQPDGRLQSRKKKQKANTIRVVEETPTKFTGSIYPTNLLQQKERFLKYGILPQFILRASVSQIEALTNKPLGKVSHQHLQSAIKVLQLVKEKYRSGDEFFKHAFGDRIDISAASSYLTQYLNASGLDGHINIVFSSDLDCSARMMWHGPHVKQNKPEARKHTLIIKNSPDNFYLREYGIICLANHEIGTHYPWYADRKMFGLRSTRGYHFRKTEEGLAALNTILQAKSRYLFGPALLYYIACMAETMTFKELFHHLEEYVKDPERRWHYVMRVKRHLPDPNDLGGLGKDQCYFEGAMEILQDVDNLELPLIYSGTLCSDETSRVKRLARLDCLKLPQFLEDIEGYRQQLRWIGYTNGILPKPIARRMKYKKITSRPPLGLIPGGREPGSRQALKRSTSSQYNSSQPPSNMVLIHDNTDSQPKIENDEPLSTDDVMSSPQLGENANDGLPPKHPATKAQSGQDSNCILQKISSRLTFHDDLIKRVESRLTCAALSLKQSEKIMLNGLQGKSGLAAPPLTALHPVNSPVPSTTSVGSSGYSSMSPGASFDCTRRDSGNFSVQSRPPTQQSSQQQSDRDLLTTWVDKEIKQIQNQQVKEKTVYSSKPLLLRRYKTQF